jgi:hypothetical protein
MWGVSKFANLTSITVVKVKKFTSGTFHFVQLPGWKRVGALEKNTWSQDFYVVNW